jgi:hypothetical protein
MPSPNHEASKTQRRVKRSSFACSNCRRRKTRCDGTHPKCKTCSVYDEVCNYELAPSLRYVRELEARVQSLERLVGVFAPLNSSSITDSVLENGDSRNERLELTVSASGEINHHNLTSLFTLPPSSLVDGSATSLPTNNLVVQDHNAYKDLQPIKDRLTQNALEQRRLELYALSTLPKEIQLPLGIHEYLLDCHWKWIQPFFNFIYRPSFMRDMRSQDGQYYSPFLLYSILAHSARFCKSRERLQTYTYFLNQAKALLPAELDKPGSIPTIQGMLLLSANATSLGLRTQAWTYSGIAFRMLVDMGLHLDQDRLAAKSSFSEEDAEVRRRLFWSCYLWDKLISLYFGRMPVLQSTTRSPLAIILDDYAENDLWHDGKPLQCDFVSDVQPSYPSVAANSVSCFTHAGKLSEIINKIVVRFYCYSFREERQEESAESLTADLLSWNKNLPVQLSRHFDLSKEHCPPAHIATLM